MNEEVIEEAKKLLAPLDLIIDLYDMSYLWGSQKILDLSEYTLDELQKLRSVDLIDKSDKEDRFISHRLVNKHGVSTVILKSKTGKKIPVESEYQVFEHNSGLYMAVKGLKVGE